MYRQAVCGVFLLCVLPISARCQGSLPDQPKPNRRAFITLAVLGQIAAGADVQSTISLNTTAGSEMDPLAKPIVALGRPGYVAASVALVGGLSYFGWRLGTSRRFHRVWWVPQVAQITANSLFAARNELIYTGCHIVPIYGYTPSGTRFVSGEAYPCSGW